MASRYANPDLWVDACDQAISVAAKTTVATFAARITGITDVDWVVTLNVAALAALVSLLTSIATAKEPT